MLLALTSTYASVALYFAHIIQPGALVNKRAIFDDLSGEPTIIIAILSGAQRPSFHPMMIFNRCAGISTAVVLIFTEVFARTKIPSTSNSLPNPLASEVITSNNALTSANKLPFSSLNISFALVVVLHILVNVLFKEPIMHYGIQMSVMLPSLLATNRKAKKHLATRLWQHKESLIVGRNKSCRMSINLHGKTLNPSFTPMKSAWLLHIWPLFTRLYPKQTRKLQATLVRNYESPTD